MLTQAERCKRVGFSVLTRLNQGWRVGDVGAEVFLGSRSQTRNQKIVLARVESRNRKIMLNSDSQSFARMEGFLCHEQITKVCWSK